jgi:hypothetical protein
MNYKMMGPIECMSLITRIVSRLGILEGKVVPVIHGDRSLIDKAYLIQGIYLRAVWMIYWFSSLWGIQIRSHYLTQDFGCIILRH